MSKQYLLALAATVVLLAGSSGAASAQRPAHYYPARPKFSNFLLYQQFNATGIPNYYTFVQPAQQYEQVLSRARTSQLRTRVPLTVEQEVAAALDAQLKQRLSTGIGRPAIPAQFNETSHFYQIPRYQPR